MNSYRPSLVFLGLVFTSGLAFGEACHSTDVNSNHCSFLEGDATCAGRHDGALPYCGGDCIDSEHDDGCVSQVPVDCYYPCGGDMLADDDMSCVGMTEANPGTLDTSGDPSGDPTTNADSSGSNATMTSGETETTDPTGTTGPQGCQNSGECTNPAEPVCLDNQCVPCTDTPDGDTACMSKDANFPVCNDDGQCVQCNAANDAACTDTTPVCDAGTSTCVGCTYHEQCPDTACNVADGSCNDGVVFHVDGDAGCSNAGAGTEADPFCDIQVGIDAAGGEGVVIVHAAAPYVEDLTVDGGSIVAVIADAEPKPEVRPAGSNPTLQLSGVGTQLYVEGLRFASNTNAVALSLAEGRAWLDRLEVVQNSSSGSGVEVVTGAAVHIRSSIISGNGSDLGPTFGLRADDATLELLASTVVNNDSSAPGSLICLDGEDVVVRNSIVMSDDPSGGSIDCDSVTASYSAFDENVAGEGNVSFAQMLSWFVMPASGDYRLSATGQTQFEDIALVVAGDYPFDVEGDPRPAAGAMDHAGADTP